MSLLRRTLLASAAGLWLLAGIAAAEEEDSVAAPDAPPDTSLAKEVDKYIEETTPDADPTAFRSFWKDGFKFETADGRFKIAVSGRAYWDTSWRSSSDFPLATAGGDNITGDTTFFRAARLGVSGTIHQHTIFKVDVDFATGTAKLKDVFLGLTRLGWAGDLLAGHIKETFSLSAMNSSRYIFFMERAAPTNAFAPGRNVGIALHNYTLLGKRLTAALGIFRTTDDQGAAVGDGNYSLTLRVTGLIIRDEGKHMFLHAGFAYSYRGDDMVQYRARPGTGTGAYLVSTGQLSVDDTSLFNFTLAFVWMSMVATVEFYYTDNNLTGAGSANFDGGYLEIGYWITGERQAWSVNRHGNTRPKRNLHDGAGGWGAVYIGYRFDIIDLNSGAVMGGKQETHSVGVTWRWNPNVRVMFEYIFADVKSGPEGPGQLNIFQMRWQFDF
ncbi:MAG: OprO/OprP family phosphate-selective porin [Planctomycetota bacterium]|jgi:phosphate-selective porin OprO/OprP